MSPGHADGQRELRALLVDARRRGFLGRGAIDAHLRHAEAMATVAGLAPGVVVDLGSGGGIPGLVLAGRWPESRIVLVEAQRSRAEFLQAAVGSLGLGDRVTVADERAEVAARRVELRGSADVVTARSFGAPPVTAECAVGFLRTGGLLVVSEPPGGDADRWPRDELAPLGLRLQGLRVGSGGSFAVLEALGEPDDRWPRRDGVPAKRPLW